MKRTFLAALCVTLLLTQLAMPRHSQAGIGLLMGERGKPLAIAGGATIAAGTAVFLASTSFDNLQTIVVMQILGAAAVVVGLVLLEETDRPLVFKEVSEAEATQLALTPVELEEFNASIDEINAVSQQIGRELSIMKDYSFEDSRALWDRYRTRIPSEAAFSAVGKISGAWLEQLKRRAS